MRRRKFSDKGVGKDLDIFPVGAVSLYHIFLILYSKLLIIFKALVLNPYVHVLCSSWLLRLCIYLYLYFCLFTSELICLLSPMLGIIIIFVVSFVNAHILRSHFKIIT
jgi:hypothetical protein